MKWLIRDKSTGAFFNRGQWVEDVRLAQEIRSSGEALRIQARYNLKAAEVYCLAGSEPNGNIDRAIPLPECWTRVCYCEVRSEHPKGGWGSGAESGARGSELRVEG